MNNEILWFIFAITNFLLVTAAYKLFGKKGLFAWIAFGTILANIQVTKTIELFGLTATLGNIMYGTLFLVTDSLGEKYGKKEALRAVVIGFFALLSSVVIMQLALKFTPHEYDFAQNSLETIFELLPRIAAGSLIAYAVSQFLDVTFFEKIKTKAPDDKFLFIRNNGSTIISQLIDTAIFVPIAFLGADGYSNRLVWEIFWTTYFIKVIVACLDTPFIYWIKKIKPLNLFEEEKNASTEQI